MGKFFRELISDTNSLNEKTFVGLMAFILVIVTITCDIITGFMGKEMPIHEFVFDGIMFIVLGARTLVVRASYIALVNCVSSSM